MRQLGTVLVLSLTLIAPVATATDPWDLGAGDDGAGTDNELIPGSTQQHDLQAVGGVADQDWYLVSQKPYSSYEILVDGLSESVASIPPTTAADPIQVQLVDNLGGNLLLSTGVSEIGSSRSLRIRNATSTENSSQFIRVQPSVNGCNISCTSDAVYRITLRETTIFAPRFNNSGTQVTVVMLQNTHNGTINYAVRFYSTAGALLTSATGNIAARSAVVLSTASIPALAGLSGTMTVDHSAPYGALIGKSVALEPSTGFSFDTPFSPRHY
jgi:hypothetical protein